MEVQGAHIAVMGDWVMLGVVITHVATAGFPEDHKLPIVNAVLQPIETHVNGFGALLFDCAIDNPTRHTVVSGEGSGGLGMAHFTEGGADGHSSLGVVESSGSFSLGGRGDNVAHDAGEDMACAIESGRSTIQRVGMGAEKIETGGSGAGLGLGQVGGIGVDVEDHVAGRVTEGGFRVGGGIIEEINTGVGSGFSGVGLLGGDGAKGNKHGVV